jgi:muconolactone delta-isomerase
MADAGLHFLDIFVRPCAYVKDVIQGSWRNLQEGVGKDGHGRNLSGFKVIGENRLVAVLDGGIESAVAALNAAYGDQIEVKCTPLRTYEGFAEHVLGVDKALVKQSPRKMSSDGRLFWIHVSVGYRGLSATDLITAWAREATTILSLRNRGDMELQVYKVVAQRELHLFMKAPDAEIMDDITFTFPLMKEMGDQVQSITKSVMYIDSSAGSI